MREREKQATKIERYRTFKYWEETEARAFDQLHEHWLKHPNTPFDPQPLDKKH